MYTLRPLQENFEITHKPTCMYSMKNYYEDNKSQKLEKVTTEKVLSNSVSFNDLLKRQQSILERLNFLENKVDKLLSTKTVKKIDLDKFEKQAALFKKVNQKQNINEKVKDVVVQIDPENISYSIAILFYQLCSKFKCFVKFYTHGTTIENVNKNSYCKKLNDLFNLLKLDITESRLNYDYGFTIIWKKADLESTPLMYLDSLKSSPIFGESNILRFLSRLLVDQSYENVLNSSQLALVDDLIDNGTTQIKNSNDSKLNATFLKRLNDLLKNSKFLTSDNSVTIADIYVWSILKQKSDGSLLRNFNFVNQWLNNIESIDVFQLFSV